MFTYSGQSHKAVERANAEAANIDKTSGQQRSDIPANQTGEEYFQVEDMAPLFLRPLLLWKRVEDIVGALLAIIVFAPLMLLIAIGVKLSSPGPVIFKRKRVGRGGKTFTFYKFRTMYVGAEEKKQELLSQNEVDGPVFKMRNDPRVTPFGRFRAGPV